MIKVNGKNVRDANFVIGSGITFETTRDQLQDVWKHSHGYPGCYFTLLANGIIYKGRFHSSIRLQNDGFLVTMILK